MALLLPAIHHTEPLASRAGAAASPTALATSAGKAQAPHLIDCFGRPGLFTNHV